MILTMNIEFNIEYFSCAYFMSGLPVIDSASLSDSRFLRPATCMGRHNSSAVATPARNPPWPPSHTEAPLFVCGAGGLKASCDVRSAWPEQEANERISSTPQPCKPRFPLTSSCSLGGGATSICSAAGAGLSSWTRTGNRDGVNRAPAWGRTAGLLPSAPTLALH